MNSNNKKTGITLFLLFSIAVASFVGVGYAGANGGEPTIYVSPSFQTVPLNKTFNISIMLDPNGESLSGAQCYVSFDPSILTVEGITNGGMFDYWAGTQNVNNGLIEGISAFNLGGNTTTTLGIFANITFKANAVGASYINIILGDPENPSTFLMAETGAIIPQAINGSVVAGAIPVVVEPSYQILPGNKTFSVNVSVYPTRPIAGIQFDMHFDPSIIQAESVQVGDIFNGHPFQFDSGNNINGEITGVYGFITETGGNVSEPGVFAVITFKTKDIDGISPLNLTNVSIYDEHAAPVPVMIFNASVEVDATPPEVNITSLSPSVVINNTTYVKTPLTVNATATDDNLAEAYLMIMDNETKQYFYGKTCYYGYYDGVPPTNYSETWEYLYNLTNGTTWEEYVSVWTGTWNETTYYSIFGLFNETGGTPEMPVVASFDENLTFIGISTYMGEPVNFTYGVSAFLLQNMVASEPGYPQYVNTSTFVITEDFRLVPVIPPEKEYLIAFSAGDIVGNWNGSGMIILLDNIPPSIEKTVGEPSVAYDGTYYVSTSTQITASAEDTGVGLASLQYRIWNGTWTEWMTYEEPITFSEACTHYLEINATDLLGNSIIDNETFYVDITPPSIEKTVGEPSVAYGDAYYVTTSTQIVISAIDAGCNGGVGLDSIQYRIWYNGWSDWVDYEAAITFTGECIHYLEIKATDSLGNVAYDNETFSVDKNPPTSTSQLSGTKEGNVYTTNVYISISSSDAKSGVKYTKYRIDGDAWQTYVGAFTVTSEGTHTLQFYSVDKLGNTETTQTKTFEILKNKAPTASFTYSPAKPKDTQSVNFDASASSDPDGTIANYTWNFGDGSVGYGKNPSHKYADNGNYTVTLTVKDDKGATDVATKQIEVLNEAPEAYFTHQPDEPKVNEEVTFTDASSDTDGSIVNWTWDFGDGNVSYEQNPTHKYDKSGTYTVKLTVKDNDGATGERTFDITVKKEKVDYLLPLIAIIILVIIAIILVAIWKRRTKKEE